MTGANKGRNIEGGNNFVTHIKDEFNRPQIEKPSEDDESLKSSVVDKKSKT